jgi:hypothetical protein
MGVILGAQAVEHPSGPSIQVAIPTTRNLDNLATYVPRTTDRLVVVQGCTTGSSVEQTPAGFNKIGSTVVNTWGTRLAVYERAVQLDDPGKVITVSWSPNPAQRSIQVYIVEGSGGLVGTPASATATNGAPSCGAPSGTGSNPVHALWVLAGRASANDLTVDSGVPAGYTQLLEQTGTTTGGNRNLGMTAGYLRDADGTVAAAGAGSTVPNTDWSVMHFALAEIATPPEANVFVIPTVVVDASTSSPGAGGTLSYSITQTSGDTAQVTSLGTGKWLIEGTGSMTFDVSVQEDAGTPIVESITVEPGGVNRYEELVFDGTNWV